MTNRILTLLFVPIAGILATGCQQGAGAAKPGQVVQIGTTKVDVFGVPAEYRALHMALEKQFNQPVSFSMQSNGTAIGKQLEIGNVPYAILSAAEYAAVEDPGKLTLLASGVNSLGKTSHQAHIVVRANSHVKTISDCAGKRFAFGVYKDPLTDTAARKALEQAGVPMNKILPEILPPPLAFEGRLYVSPTKSWFDLTVNAGVVDEIDFNKMPETGGNPITGPSKDQFKIVGETAAIPEIVVVAGPSANPQVTEKLKDFLLNKAKDDKMLCEQLDIQGFAPADRAIYDASRSVLSPT
jgi:ABC-type phosphate/phosphonate transport system substrate-binding protein